eukprot:gene4276-7987_t
MPGWWGAAFSDNAVVGEAVADSVRFMEENGYGRWGDGTVGVGADGGDATAVPLVSTADGRAWAANRSYAQLRVEGYVYYSAAGHAGATYEATQWWSEARGDTLLCLEAWCVAQATGA